jgi:dihydrofolate reductase
VFTKANKYVLTGGSAKLDWASSHRLRNLDELKKVKAEEGPDIVLWGSSTLYPQLLDANLIDCLQLLTIPMVLGKGKKIFGNTSHPVTLKLMKCEATPTGAIIATYEREGAVPTAEVYKHSGAPLIPAFGMSGSASSSTDS